MSETKKAVLATLDFNFSSKSEPELWKVLFDIFCLGQTFAAFDLSFAWALEGLDYNHYVSMNLAVEMKSSWQSQDSNLGLLGEKRERNLCAMPSFKKVN